MIRSLIINRNAPSVAASRLGSSFSITSLVIALMPYKLEFHLSVRSMFLNSCVISGFTLGFTASIGWDRATFWNLFVAPTTLVMR